MSNVVFSNVTCKVSELNGVWIFLRYAFLIFLIFLELLDTLLNIEHLLLASCSIHLILEFLSFLFLKDFELILKFTDLLISSLLFLFLLLSLNLLFEVFFFNFDFIIGMPHVLSLDGSEVDVLSHVIFTMANTKRLNVLPLFKSCSDSSLYEETLDFNLLHDFGLAFVL